MDNKVVGVSPEEAKARCRGITKDAIRVSMKKFDPNAWATYVRDREELKKKGFSGAEARWLAMSWRMNSGYDPKAAIEEDIEMENGEIKDGIIPLEDVINNSTDAIEVTWWVFNALATNPNQQDAPSPGAWGYYNYLKTNTGARNNFYSNIWPKLIPNKTHIDTDKKARDESRELRFLEELSSSSEALHAEPILPLGSEGPSEKSGVEEDVVGESY